MWFMMQYLQKIPEKGFSNNVDQGFVMNVAGSIMALFGVKGFESDPGWSSPRLTFPPMDKEKSYYINWDRAVIYLIPQLPSHKRREQILEMMKKDEPRMIEMYKLQKRFKEEVMAEEGASQLN